jgi:putative MFS transporter
LNARGFEQIERESSQNGTASKRGNMSIGQSNHSALDARIRSAATGPELILRLERIPISNWHLRARVIVGLATFFDAFDALAIATVVPALAPLWKLTPADIGPLISAGFLGQLIGALFFGWLADRIGRLHTAVLTVAIFGVMSLACGAAWSYESLLIFRFIQGLGLGGEVPIAAAYISELSRSSVRGRFFLLYELVFLLGLVAVSVLSVWVVPTFGWRYMFYIGAIPAVLAVGLRFLLRESPRWLISRGRLSEAEAIIRDIERSVPPGRLPLPPSNFASIKEESVAVGTRTRWAELFSAQYLGRTILLWALWFSVYLIAYGLTTWLPTVYRVIFRLDLRTALEYGVILSVAGLCGAFICAMLIDRIGRRIWFTIALIGSSLPLIALWAIGAPNAEAVLALSTASFFFVATLGLALYLYTAELYPTRIRSLGSGAATAWLRLAAVVGPILVGLLLPAYGLPSVFLLFAGSALAGAGVAALFMIETKKRVLEELSP